MDKKEVIEILQSIEIKHKERLQEYLNKIANSNEEVITNILKSENIQSDEDLKAYIKNKVDVEHKFIQLNDLISYGYSKDTVHIHLVPKDAKFLLNRNGLSIAEYKLIDALEKLQDIIESNDELKDIKQVYAVSGLIKRPISKLFEKLDFDVKIMRIKDAKNDSELSHFYERFKDKKDLGRAILTKEKLFSQEWNKLKDERKKDLIFKLDLEELTRNMRLSEIEKVGENLPKEKSNLEKEIQ